MFTGKVFPALFQCNERRERVLFANWMEFSRKVGTTPFSRTEESKNVWHPMGKAARDAGVLAAMAGLPEIILKKHFVKNVKRSNFIASSKKFHKFKKCGIFVQFGNPRPTPNYRLVLAKDRREGKLDKGKSFNYVHRNLFSARTDPAKQRKGLKSLSFFCFESCIQVLVHLSRFSYIVLEQDFRHWH